MSDKNYAMNQFRESFRGFNKEDVADFFANLCRDFAEKESFFKSRAEKAESELASKANSEKELIAESRRLNAEIQRLNDEIIAFSKKDAEFAERQSNNAEFKIIIDDLNKDNKKLSAELELCREESQKLRDENKRLLDNVSRLESLKKENDELYEKINNLSPQYGNEQSIYKNVTSELGEIIYTAKEKAKLIVAEAESEARDIIDAANAKKLAADVKISNMNNEAEQFYRQLSEANDIIKTVYDENISRINLHIQNAVESLKSTD